jgi:hypothetical protein
MSFSILPPHKITHSRKRGFLAPSFGDRRLQNGRSIARQGNPSRAVRRAARSRPGTICGAKPPPVNCAGRMGRRRNSVSRKECRRAPWRVELRRKTSAGGPGIRCFERVIRCEANGCTCAIYGGLSACPCSGVRVVHLSDAALQELAAMRTELLQLQTQCESFNGT